MNYFNSTNITSGFDITIVGINNPLKTSVPISPGISVFILSNPWNVVEYNYDLGDLEYDAASDIFYF